ncbi:alpha-ketoglutarate-dependent dioxygenase AlkB family protein [Paraferrimonas sedimenticola]|uniref:2OG-Fe(II) oxygenase n=1 Tax=Paraferrimonas sedimenticola TaxID=375674 RepID=A0AA37RWW7_9GAMM|nr:alpha-ketoglutarate-dependent dioxygenase AlkB [Paraferrimonas sedimenticola]GLP96798.1 2OG-Fe(II) oxygenase [Paraferrimonas sedimenticola]
MANFSKSEKAILNKQAQILPDGALTRVPNWLSETEQTRLQQAMQDYPWESPEIKVFGRWHQIPRQQVWFAFEAASYRYSGKDHIALAMPQELRELCARINEQWGIEMNSVLLNHYCDGRDSMGWHADNESELAPNQPIVSLTLGAARDFILRHNTSKQRVKLPLNPGELLIMWPPMQHHWQHSVPKRASADPRINLTFRCLSALSESAADQQ